MRRAGPALVLAALVGLAAVLPGIPDAVRPGLPAVSDVTGLSGQGLLAADGGAPEVVRLRIQGQSRNYLLAPARRVARRADPGLLVVLPAANRSVQQTYDLLELDPFRDHGLTVVVAGPTGGWNAGTCCGRAVTTAVDDIAALRVMVADAAARAGADAERLAVMGYSVGGFLVYRLLCDGGLDVDAMVEVAGSLATSCDDPPPLPPTLALHGTLDETVPLGPSTRPVGVLGITPLSVREAVRRVSEAAGCTAGRCPLRLDEVSGSGHRWEDLEPAQRIAAFLAEHVPGVR